MIHYTAASVLPVATTPTDTTDTSQDSGEYITKGKGGRRKTTKRPKK